MGKNPHKSDPGDVETAVYLPSILKILGWPRRRFWKRRMELWQSGVIFYRYEGSPQHRRILAFPSRVQRWIASEAMKGKII